MGAYYSLYIKINGKQNSGRNRQEKIKMCDKPLLFGEMFCSICNIMLALELTQLILCLFYVIDSGRPDFVFGNYLSDLCPLL